MGKKRMTAIDDAEKEKLFNKAFYLTESFFGTGDSAQSMNILAPKLLEAKTTDEIEAVYRQYIVDPQALGQDVWLLEIAIRDYYSQQDGFEDPTPLYAKWLYYTVQAASACLDLYKVCLRVARREANKSAVANIMDMLYFANKAFEQMLAVVRNKEVTLREVYDAFHLKDSDYHSVPVFPLVFFFREFQEQHGEHLQEKYGFSYNQLKVHERYKYHYWENPSAEKELRTSVWGTAINSKVYNQITYSVESWNGEKRTVCIIPDGYASDLKHLSKFDDQWLAERILRMLDQYTDNRLTAGVLFKVSSTTGKIKVASECLETALFLWIITQIQNTEDYRICKICGKVFKVRSQKTRQYCYSHKKAAIDYFNRKLHKQKLGAVEQEEHMHPQLYEE